MAWQLPSLRASALVLRAVVLYLFAVTLLAPGASFATKKPPLKPINLNTATSEQLQQVPGIGPATAGKILQMRKSYGPFKSVDDLRAIKGIGPKRLAKMKPYLTVAKPAKSASSKNGGALQGKSSAGDSSKPPVKSPPSGTAPENP